VKHKVLPAGDPASMLHAMACELPRLAVGDVLLVGKFKNRRATIIGFSLDENNQPVALTDKGEHKIFKPRIAKLMPAKV
jgi:hypothetical protein